MRKLTTLLATLVLASTASIAMASPARSYASGSTPRPAVSGPSYQARARVGHARSDASYRIWNGQHGADDAGPRRYRASWSALAAPFELGRSDRGSDCIDVTDRGTFTQLRVQADSGRAFVDRVTVVFADGSDQQVHLDRALGAGSNFVDIPLDGNNRRVAQVIVAGDTGNRAALQVFAI
jgi:hypothetical protein